jgi:hypothetical protein
MEVDSVVLNELYCIKPDRFQKPVRFEKPVSRKEPMG